MRVCVMKYFWRSARSSALEETKNGYNRKLTTCILTFLESRLGEIPFMRPATNQQTNRIQLINLMYIDIWFICFPLNINFQEKKKKHYIPPYFFQILIVDFIWLSLSLSKFYSIYFSLSVFLWFVWNISVSLALSNIF